MSYFVGEVPEVAVKPGKMINITTSKMKAILVAAILILYAYLLLHFKTIYLRNKRIDELMAMVSNTERELLNVHTLDKELVMQMEQIDRLYEDY